MRACMRGALTVTVGTCSTSLIGVQGVATGTRKCTVSEEEMSSLSASHAAADVMRERGAGGGCAAAAAEAGGSVGWLRVPPSPSCSAAWIGWRRRDFAGVLTGPGAGRQEVGFAVKGRETIADRLAVRPGRIAFSSQSSHNAVKQPGPLHPP